MVTRLAGAVVALSMVLGQGGRAAEPRQLAAMCAGCHGSTGRGDGIPALGGLPESTLLQAMLAYRAGERRSQIMQVVAGSLSPDEIAAVAHYLAGTSGVTR